MEDGEKGDPPSTFSFYVDKENVEKTSICFLFPCRKARVKGRLVYGFSSNSNHNGSLISLSLLLLSRSPYDFPTQRTGENTYKQKQVTFLKLYLTFILRPSRTSSASDHGELNVLLLTKNDNKDIRSSVQ